MNYALLDTDACIEIIRGNPAPIESAPDFAFVVSAVSRFEIVSGLKGKRSTRIEERALAFLDVADIRPFDGTAADAAARIRIELESAGRPIGAYDLLLAGHAMALDLPILTGNENEFARVPGLRILNWRNQNPPI